MSKVKTEVIQCPGIPDRVTVRVVKESDEPGFISLNMGSVSIPKKKITTLIKQLKAWK